jgi:hypothetical protein
MQQLHVFLGFDLSKFETWEIGLFHHDPSGRELAEPLLGVRCKGGAWIKADVLERAIANERAEGAYRSSDC